MKLKYRIIKKANKNIHLKFINSSELRITVPLHTPDEWINKIIEQKADWIVKTSKLLGDSEARVEINPESIMIMGESYKIIVQEDLGNSAKIDHNEKIVYTGISLDNIGYRSGLYRTLGTQYLKKRTWELANRYDFPLKKVGVRGQVSVWGTCSHSGNVSLNWKLMLAPKFVIDYLILHELVHLHHRNHGKGFYQELKYYCPRHDEARQWLKDHDQILRKYK